MLEMARSNVEGMHVVVLIMGPRRSGVEITRNAALSWWMQTVVRHDVWLTEHDWTEID